MTKATPKKKTTTTKKKPTVKAHRGFAHVPLRGRRRPVGDPPRRRVQKSYKDMTPAERAARRRQVELGRRRFLQGRGPLDNPRMTPAQRDALIRQRRLAEQKQRRFNQMTPAQRDALMRQRQALQRRGTPFTPPRLSIRRRPTVEQLSDARRKRRPVGDPKPRTRPTTPKQKQRVVKATQAPRTRPKPRRVI